MLLLITVPCAILSGSKRNRVAQPRAAHRSPAAYHKLRGYTTGCGAHFVIPGRKIRDESRAQ